jgi:hypothetical protein
VAWHDHILVLGRLAGPSHRMHPGWRLGALKNIYSTAKFEYTMHKVKKLKPHKVIFIKLLLKEMGYINILYIKSSRFCIRLLKYVLSGIYSINISWLDLPWVSSWFRPYFYIISQINKVKSLLLNSTTHDNNSLSLMHIVIDYRSVI